MADLIRCLIWHSPLFQIVPDGIQIRCKSCRGDLHHISRSEIERIWEEMNKAKTVIAEKSFATNIALQHV